MLALGIYNLAKCPDPTGDDCTSLLSSRSITSEGYHYELEVPCEDKGQAATLSRSDHTSKWSISLTYLGDEDIDAVNNKILATTASVVLPTRSPCGEKFKFCNVTGSAVSTIGCELNVVEVAAATNNAGVGTRSSPRRPSKSKKVASQQELFMDELKAAKVGDMYVFSSKLANADLVCPWDNGADCMDLVGEKHLHVKRLPHLGDREQYEAVLVSAYDESTGLVTFAANVKETSTSKGGRRQKSRTFARKYQINVDEYFGGLFNEDFMYEGSRVAVKSTSAYSVVELINQGIIEAKHAQQKKAIKM